MLTRRPFARSRAVAKGAVVDVVVVPAATTTTTPATVIVNKIDVATLIVVEIAAPEAADGGGHARGNVMHMAVKMRAT